MIIVRTEGDVVVRDRGFNVVGFVNVRQIRNNAAGFISNTRADLGALHVGGRRRCHRAGVVVGFGRSFVFSPIGSLQGRHPGVAGACVIQNLPAKTKEGIIEIHLEAFGDAEAGVEADIVEHEEIRRVGIAIDLDARADRRIRGVVIHDRDVGRRGARGGEMSTPLGVTNNGGREVIRAEIDRMAAGREHHQSRKYQKQSHVLMMTEEAYLSLEIFSFTQSEKEGMYIPTLTP